MRKYEINYHWVSKKSESHCGNSGSIITAKNLKEAKEIVLSKFEKDNFRTFVKFLECFKIN